MSQQAVLVTGGTGYIGSHTVVQLLAAGAHVVILDNLSNSHLEVLRRIETIAGLRPLFIEGDIRDRPCLKALFKAHAIDAVIRLQGLRRSGSPSKSRPSIMATMSPAPLR